MESLPQTAPAHRGRDERLGTPAFRPPTGTARDHRCRARHVDVDPGRRARALARDRRPRAPGRAVADRPPRRRPRPARGRPRGRASGWRCRPSRPPSAATSATSPARPTSTAPTSSGRGPPRSAVRPRPVRSALSTRRRPRCRSTLVRRRAGPRGPPGRHAAPPARALPALRLVLIRRAENGACGLTLAQRDRFLLKVAVRAPDAGQERILIDVASPGLGAPEIRAVTDPDQVRRARRVLPAIHMDGRVKDYVVRLVHATRRPAQGRPPAGRAPPLGGVAPRHVGARGRRQGARVPRRSGLRQRRGRPGRRPGRAVPPRGDRARFERARGSDERRLHSTDPRRGPRRLTRTGGGGSRRSRLPFPISRAWVRPLRRRRPGGPARATSGRP